MVDSMNTPIWTDCECRKQHVFFLNVTYSLTRGCGAKVASNKKMVPFMKGHITFGFRNQIPNGPLIKKQLTSSSIWIRWPSWRACFSYGCLNYTFKLHSKSKLLLVLSKCVLNISFELLTWPDHLESLGHVNISCRKQRAGFLGYFSQASQALQNGKMSSDALGNDGNLVASILWTKQIM